MLSGVVNNNTLILFLSHWMGEGEFRIITDVHRHGIDNFVPSQCGNASDCTSILER